MQISARPGAADGNDTQTITLGTPDTLTVATTDATTIQSHTHAITSSNDTSAASASVLLAANTTGGLKVAELAIGTSIKITEHITTPAVTTNKLYSNSTSLFYEDTGGAYRGRNRRYRNCDSNGNCTRIVLEKG